MKDNFILSLLWYALSIAWFGGIGHIIIDSDESIIIKAFFMIGLLLLALIYFVRMTKDE